MPELEVISRTPKGAARATPLLFVHGAFAGAWVWEQHFLDDFAARGYAAHALSLRGHGESEGHESLACTSLRDYVADVERVARTLGAPPVLIGHSMGGVVVQKCLHRRDYPAAVLMASGPPHGMLGSYVNMLFRHPRLLTQLSWMQVLGPRVVDFDLVRRALFSDDTPPEALARYLPRLEAESIRAVLDLWGLDLPPSRRLLDLPVLVLGAGNDPLIYPGAVRQTAWTYRTEAEIFPEMAHAMMLDHHWPRVASRIAGWLETALPAAREAA